MPVAEERIAVGHALVRAAGDAQHCLAAPDMFERERQAVDRDPVTPGDEPLRLFGVALRVRPSRQPPAVVTTFRRTERRVREDVLVADLLAPAERLEDSAPRRLV